MRVVLYNPEIPQNTGNIARTCAATRSDLYLIEPLGFELKDKYMKRAGLDYFDMVNITVLPSFDKLMEMFPDAVWHFASTKAPRSYTEAHYGKELDRFRLRASSRMGMRMHLSYTRDNNDSGRPFVSQPNTRKSSFP